jgi:hypothetical protein
MSKSKRRRGGPRAKDNRHRGTSHSSSKTADKRRNDQEVDNVRQPDHEQTELPRSAQASSDWTSRMVDIGLPDVIVLPDREDQAYSAQASDRGDQAGDVLPAERAPNGPHQVDLIDRSFEFLTYLIDTATESKETQKLLLKAGRHLRRSVRQMLVFFVLCALMLGIGIGVAVLVAGLKPLAAVLIGATGSATFLIIGGLGVRTLYVRAKRFFLRLTARQQGDPPRTNRSAG